MIELKLMGFKITTCLFSSNFEVRVTRLDAKYERFKYNKIFINAQVKY